MDKQRILEIANNVYSQYRTECEANGGREGSTEAYRLLSQMDLLQDILFVEFGFVWDFKRFI